MLKGQKKPIDKEQGKAKHEAPRSVNYRATQNKNNIGTTALERPVVHTTVGLKAFHCTNFSQEMTHISLSASCHILFTFCLLFVTVNCTVYNSINIV